eukprot:366036-Chlamydomonas_euryale.AAC.24
MTSLSPAFASSSTSCCTDFTSFMFEVVPFSHLPGRRGASCVRGRTLQSAAPAGSHAGDAPASTRPLTVPLSSFPTSSDVLLMHRLPGKLKQMQPAHHGVFVPAPTAAPDTRTIIRLQQQQQQQQQQRQVWVCGVLWDLGHGHLWVYEREPARVPRATCSLCMLASATLLVAQGSESMNMMSFEGGGLATGC